MHKTLGPVEARRDGVRVRDAVIRYREARGFAAA